ncbi:MAG TPA: ornithine cyclodeaminase family protein [Ramlibacter sp.]|nr:ornithine cyclodeaminase family protein [Ramlibacter sp.]
MPTTGTLLYLSSADIDALGLTAAGVEPAISEAYRALGEGRAGSVPKIGFNVGPSTFFHAMPALYTAKGLLGLKWIGTADNSATGLPHISALIVLSDVKTAVLRAVLDGTQVTAIRPAAVSLAAARHLARKDSRRIAFVACGVQALAHLEAFRQVFPLQEVTCYSRRLESAERFAQRAREMGLQARAVGEARAAVEGQDIVVSSAPRASFPEPFLDPGWLSPGAYVSGVDLGRSWKTAGLRALDLIATDNREQSASEAAQKGVLPWKGDWDADLAELASGTHRGRTQDRQRAFFIHPGLGLGDLAIAVLAYEMAQARGLGTELPR